MANERRSNTRVPLLLEARWESLSGKHAARTTDLSLEGCYIESIGQVTVGERVSFEIQLSNGNWLPLRGQVLYYQPNLGFGLRFSGLTEQERKVLAQLIRGGSPG